MLISPFVGKVLLGVALLVPTPLNVVSYHSNDGGGSDQSQDQVQFPLLGGASRPRPASSVSEFQRYSGRSDQEDLKIAWLVGYDSVMAAIKQAGQSGSSLLPINPIGQAVTALGENLAKTQPAEQQAPQASQPTTPSGPSIKPPQTSHADTGPMNSNTQNGRSHPQVELGEG